MKDILKEIKLNESVISMILGTLVVLAVGALIVSNFRNQGSFNFLQSNSSEEQTSQTEGDIQIDDGSTYTVTEGDSLWSIAEQEYGTGYEWTEIAAANPGIQDGDIEVGQEIVIPDTDKILEEAASTEAIGVEETGQQPVAQAQPTSTPSEQSADQTEASERTYTVQRGDSLWDIAVEVYGDGYRWTDIAQANNLVNPGLIHSGNVLSLPA
jgi:nucleoid-associated protein YgaU